ncbi:MAG: MalY/PatB family protein [Mesotoga sp.]|uniref:MalY/PatB family protein n=2 Tax=Mesotoga sp. TaxID=2053577 RepID=UPI00261A652A|nr:MalY/PatB family protein [Mesotoga sp.]MDD3679992.1 pyridoxal phosphate-dependent aminotransferase [Mesotoga sp.]MDD4826480.1 pyridoxal phosphate-dependent aminotransferase [Mesotoga sp.]MDD5681954.1 pyridoxal phosphate-dependent aminotransferase [Mesotoga sp.]MDI9369146.1 MalY/PatB family protein [Thermotogota bacterium]
MKYNFDRIIERRGTDCIKWDHADLFFGRNDLLPMWVADMDFESPPEVVEAIVTRAKHGIYGYTARSDSYYESIVSWLSRRHGWEVKKEWISHAPGVVSAVHIAIMAFSHPGDKVIVQTPVYYPFFKAIEETGRQLIQNPLMESGGRYTMDLEDLERKIDSRTKIIILCSPHNPVGRVWTRDELSKLGEICLSRNIKIISDEIHSDLVLGNNRHIPTATLSEEVSSITLTCVAPSKTFNLAGLSSAAVISSSSVLLSEYSNMLSSVGAGMSNVFGTVALQTAYNNGEHWLEELLEYIFGNFEYMRDFLKANFPEVRVTELEGTYLAWIDFRGTGMTVEELKSFLYEKAKVGFEDGSIFGIEGEGFMRVNLACPRALVEEAMKRLINAWKS